MRHAATQVFALLFLTAAVMAQTIVTPSPATEKRGWMSHVLHPFGGKPAQASQNYKDARLRGLDLTVQIAPDPVKLSEVRQLEVKVALSNQGKRAVELTFPTEQRIDIYLLSPTGKVLTKWSENRAFEDKQSLVLLNPQERIEYSETIATRELTAGKVFTVEAFFPQYPELKVTKKFLAAQ